MILTCPACHTRYLVAPSALGASGRKVRCARCGQSWFELPPVSEELRRAAAGAGGQAQATPSPVLEGAQTPRPLPPGSNLPALLPPRRPIGRRLGWLALALVLLAGVGAGIAWRAPIVRAWPAVARLYTFAGLRTPAESPVFNVRKLKSERVMEHGRALLRVSGEIVNLSGADLPTPRIRMALKDREAREIDHWTEILAAKRIGAGQAIGFSGALADPPAEAVSLQVTLVTEG
jgi:predicted Zn finger-like uncharacterized protein